jgi:hypothetical protein
MVASLSHRRMGRRPPPMIVPLYATGHSESKNKNWWSQFRLSKPRQPRIILQSTPERLEARDVLQTMPSRERTARLQLSFSSDEVDAIENFRFCERMPTRAAAVGELLRRGMSVTSDDKPQNSN